MDGGVVALLAVAGGLLVSYLVNRRVTDRYDYRCGRCGQSFTLSAVAAAVAPHRTGGRKWTRCPNCGEFSWATPHPKA